MRLLWLAATAAVGSFICVRHAPRLGDADERRASHARSRARPARRPGLRLWREAPRRQDRFAPQPARHAQPARQLRQGQCVRRLAPPSGKSPRPVPRRRTRRRARGSGVRAASAGEEVPHRGVLPSSDETAWAFSGFSYSRKERDDRPRAALLAPDQPSAGVPPRASAGCGPRVGVRCTSCSSAAAICAQTVSGANRRSASARARRRTTGPS